ncbi:MAG: hypothetical protein ACYCY7_08160 [Gallionella sp.]
METKGKSGILLAMMLSLSACIFLPTTSNDESSCETHTRSMTLQKIDAGAGLSPQSCNNNQECMPIVAVIVAVSAGSLLVSGSIVVVNNTVHWLEYQGTCSEGFLSRTRQAFLDTFKNTKALVVRKTVPAP